MGQDGGGSGGGGREGQPNGAGSSAGASAAGSGGGDADAATPLDAGQDAQIAPMDAAMDAALDAAADAGTDAAADASTVPDLTPQRRDCNAVPSGQRCQGGPVEVLLLAHQRGRIAVIDPQDGTYLGHIAEDATPLNLDAVQATQGPDNCIYVLKGGNATDFAIRRLDSDGTFIDDIIPFVSTNGSDLVADPPAALQFHNGTLYIGSPVSSSDPTPPPSVGTFDLTGAPSGEPVNDSSRAAAMLVLGDGSLLISEDNDQELLHYAAAGGAPRLVTALARPRQIAYLANGNIVVAQNVLGEPIVEIDLVTGVAERLIRPITPGTTDTCQTRGVAVLGNGRWIMTGGGCSDSFGVASIDPEGALGDMNRQGMVQHLPGSIYDDEVPSDGLSSYPNNYQYFGHACLPAGAIDAVP